MNGSKEQFNELRAIVKETGLLDRIPVRGTVEMAMILISLGLIYVTLDEPGLWNPYVLAIAITIVFTRSVFVTHDILHTQFFQSKSLSMRISYIFSSIILGLSSSWWDYKHNVLHHTWTNCEEEDPDIQVMDGIFTSQNKNSDFVMKFRRPIYWIGLGVVYPSFIIQSWAWVIEKRSYHEMVLMIAHWFIIWGTIFTILPLNEAIIVFVTLYLVISYWLALGFITNHVGLEVLKKEDAKDLPWMELQTRTSRNVNGGMFIHWFYGGLNTQIEHHLFPKGPRLNLLKVAKLTREYCEKNNITYINGSPIKAYLDIDQALKDIKS